MSAATPLSEDSANSRPLAGILLSARRARAALGLRPNAAGGGFAAAPAFAAQTQAGARAKVGGLCDASPLSAECVTRKLYHNNCGVSVNLRGIRHCKSRDPRDYSWAAALTHPLPRPCPQQRRFPRIVQIPARSRGYCYRRGAGEARTRQAAASPPPLRLRSKRRRARVPPPFLRYSPC